MRRVIAGTALAVLALAACSPDSGVTSTGQSGTDGGGTATSITGDGATTTVIAPTSTSTPVRTSTAATTTSPSPTTAATATTAGPPSTTAEATSTTAPAEPPGIPVTGAGTEWVAGAEEGDPEVADGAADCGPYLEAIGGGPFPVAECGTWDALGGVRVWTLTQAASGRWFAVIWQLTDAATWVPALRLLEPVPGTWADVSLATGNIDSGPNDELVSGIRLAGSGNYLTVEVIDIRSDAPQVVARVPDLHHGSAVLAPEGVYLYSAGFDDPECCPSTFDQSLLVSTDDGWFLAEGASGIPPDAVPTSDV